MIYSIQTWQKQQFCFYLFREHNSICVLKTNDLNIVNNVLNCTPPPPPPPPKFELQNFQCILGQYIKLMCSQESQTFFYRRNNWWKFNVHFKIVSMFCVYTYKNNVYQIFCYYPLPIQIKTWTDVSPQF